MVHEINRKREAATHKGCVRMSKEEYDKRRSTGTFSVPELEEGDEMWAYGDYPIYHNAEGDDLYHLTTTKYLRRLRDAWG